MKEWTLEEAKKDYTEEANSIRQCQCIDCKFLNIWMLSEGNMSSSNCMVMNRNMDILYRRSCKYFTRNNDETIIELRSRV